MKQPQHENNQIATKLQPIIFDVLSESVATRLRSSKTPRRVSSNSWLRTNKYRLNVCTYQSSFDPVGVVYIEFPSIHLLRTFVANGDAAGPPLVRLWCSKISGAFLMPNFFWIPVTTLFSCNQEVTECEFRLWVTNRENYNLMNIKDIAHAWPK